MGALVEMAELLVLEVLGEVQVLIFLPVRGVLAVLSGAIPVAMLVGLSDQLNLAHLLDTVVPEVMAAVRALVAVVPDFLFTTG